MRCQSVAGSGRWGALRSEVKEEGRAQPGPGDTNGAERPGGPIPRRETGYAAFASSRSARRNTFPMFDFGSGSVRNSTRRGTL